MNIYDFDGTIFPSNCAVEFALWCMKRHPKLLVTYIPSLMKTAVLYGMKKVPEYYLLRKLFSYLTMVEDIPEQVEAYWDKNQGRIAKWYLAQKQPTDLILSASPTCIIAPIAKRLGVNYMATEFDCEYGIFVNNLMYAKEKARHIIDKGFPVIDNFYSDSLSDTPIALCAEKAYIVSNRATTVKPWPELDQETMKKVEKKIDTGWNIHLKEDDNEK